MKCDAHGEEPIGACNWCGARVCDACIDDAGGKKYCANCNAKVSKAPMGVGENDWGSPPTKKVSNVDDSLNESTIKQARQMLARKGFT